LTDRGIPSGAYRSLTREEVRRFRSPGRVSGKGRVGRPRTKEVRAR
jgi:hypothetical protein